MSKDIEQLLFFIARIVEGEGDWKEKRAAIYAQCSEQQMDIFNEFISWFEISEPS